MIRFVGHVLRSHVRTGKVLFALTVLGVAIAVASVVTIQLVNRSAVRSFSAGMTAVSGDVDLTVTALGDALRDEQVVEVSAVAGVRIARPVVEVAVRVETGDRPFLDLNGVDFLEPDALPFVGAAPEPGAPLGTGGWVALTPEFAARLGLAIGDTFEVSSGTRRVTLTCGGLIDLARRRALAGDAFALMDIAQLQERFGRLGELDRVDVHLLADADRDAVKTALAARLGSSVRVAAPADERDRAEGLLRGFRLNMTALSMVSVLVGFFLVLASVQAALIRRRREFGLLRSLGATRGQVFAAILCEVGVVGVLGAAIGLPLGYAAAQANLGAVSGALTNLYLLDEIRTLDAPAWLVPLGLFVGVGGSLLGAAGPALETSRRDPRALLSRVAPHERLGRRAGALAIVALLLPAATWLWTATVGADVRGGGFLLGLTVLAALPMLTPGLVRAVAARVRVGSLGLAYAARALATRLRTTSSAVAALAVASSMLFGITTMVGSFRETVRDWVDTTIRADVYVATPSFGRGVQDAEIDDEILARLTATPGVRAVDRLRKFHVWSGEHRFAVIGVDSRVQEGCDRFPMKEGVAEVAYRQMSDDGAVLLGEPLAHALGLSVGDVLTLPAGDGAQRTFPVAGVYYDYTSEFGTAAMDLGTMATAFGSAAVNSVALYLEDGRSADATIDALREEFAGVPLTFTGNRRLRAEVDRIFDQTFAVTRILQAMSLLVAACAVALSLLILARDRAPELALYRALGATRRQVFGLFVGKGVALSVLAMLLGAAGGTGLFYVLSLSINRAYFGWTIRGAPPYAELGAQVGTILLVVFLASLYPALRASRVTPSELSRDDS